MLKTCCEHGTTAKPWVPQRLSVHQHSINSGELFIWGLSARPSREQLPASPVQDSTWCAKVNHDESWIIGESIFFHWIYWIIVKIESIVWSVVTWKIHLCRQAGSWIIKPNLVVDWCGKSLPWVPWIFHRVCLFQSPLCSIPRTSRAQWLRARLTLHHRSTHEP